jgi:Druantia protein DruA
VVKLALREGRLRRKIKAEFRRLGFSRSYGELSAPALCKDSYRKFHEPQRRERVENEGAFLDSRGEPLLAHFAAGHEIQPRNIRVRLERIQHSTWQSDLFRLACLLWSIPVSQGFGRRLRFLVWDDSCNRLLGLFALGDPVFNLRVRDDVIGWTGTEREDRLVNVLDAYVLGAVPPYNRLLGGKLVACLVRTQEVVQAFREQYHHAKGLISREEKHAQFVLATTTSALGRSSLYNRLRLGGVQYFESIGFTLGWGHFHINDSLFDEMRAYLKTRRDGYTNNHGFGDGPNWRLRAIKKTLQLLDMHPRLAKHGFQREVFISRVADNALEILTGKRKRATYKTLQSVATVASQAMDRWVLPRASRDGSYREWTRDDTLSQIRLTAGNGRSGPEG